MEYAVLSCDHTKIALKNNNKSKARVNLTHWLWLLDSNPQVQGSIPDPLASIPFSKKRSREKGRPLSGDGGFLFAVCFTVSVFFCGVVDACLRASSSPAQLSHNDNKCVGGPFFPQVHDSAVPVEGFFECDSQPWVRASAGDCLARRVPGVYTLLAVASTPSVHQIQRSLFSTFTLGPCLCLPSSPVSTFSKLPSVWRDEQGVWLVQPSSHAWRAHIRCWPNRSVIREGLFKVSRVADCAASMREEIVVGTMPRHTGAEGKTNGAIVTEKEQPMQSGQSEWQHLESHVVSPPSIVGEGPIAHELPIWPGHMWESPVDMRKQIFCNRSLNMKSIVAVGFDMDYTLAQYKPDTFESMAYAGTTKKLVNNLGYPKDLLEWKFDWKYMVRGLVLDKKRGNILKMDRHKYVKVAYHGFQRVSREERQATYGFTLSRDSYDEPDYALIDTLFSLAEAYLFMQLVDFQDQFPEKIPSGTDYAQMYKDVRAAVDLCHRDGTLKQAVAHEPSKYINDDKQIVPMLKMLRQSGRLTFLVTNSLWDYTHVVMNFLCGKSGTDGGTPRDDEWLSYFDVVVTGSAKPTFFQDGNRSPLFEVDISTGMLQNTDQGTPVAQIGGIGLNTPILPQRTVKQACRVFQGGSVAHLHRLLSIAAGAQVLYVGDHIYGDILRSKKELGWRTMLVVPELEFELEMLAQTFSIRKEVSKLRTLRDVLEDKLQSLEWALRFHNLTVEEQHTFQEKIEILQSERDKIREQHRQAQRDCHHQFHKTWGQLMKTGYQNSRFSHQVERFACLYTSQVTNLCYYSPDKSYRTTEDFMPHELEGIGL